ncbi:expressed unknown protein [Seminavis robusta]|uniref:Uncharacterized protein n=1 Tax=Seminavis robusta TaxID=568900 RepID=A0A9N8EFY4_9STRA|nr:expressed unknown protein [Seminavis robusta]|eukprot:Sro887_g216320.1 n/a (648) ;mRNA; f:29483-31426
MSGSGGKASSTGNAWSDAACYLFQPGSTLCGSMNVVIPGTAAATYPFTEEEDENFWTQASYCAAMSPSAGVRTPQAATADAAPSQEEQMDAAMKKLDTKYKFKPHMCEDRDFFVINAGATSVDVESLSTPSMGGHLRSLSEASDSSSFKLEALREGAPSFENKDQILEAPFPVLVYPNNAENNSNREAETINNSTVSSHALRGAASMIRESAPEWIVKPARAKRTFDSPEERRIPDEHRVKELLSPINPTTTPNEEVHAGRYSSKFGISSCMVPTNPPTSPANQAYDQQKQASESLRKQSSLNDCPANSAEDVEMMKKFWTEKFTQAANKVIQSDSSRRILELIDPTIPRESDGNRRTGQQSLRGRQRYRQVLKKYRKHRILVLILDPSTKLYEMLELPYRPDETTVADVLIMARIQTTDDRLRYKDYIGLCRPNLDPPPPPPLKKVESPSASTTTTPTRHQLSPPPLNRVTKQFKHMHHYDPEGREDDVNSIVSEATAMRNLAAASSMLQEVTDQDKLVWNLLSPSSSTKPTPLTCTGAIPSQLALSLPYFTLPLLGDIVVTIPKGYTGEDVSKFAQTILQTPLFLRWMHRRYLNDLQRQNDELLSRAKAIGGKNSSGGGGGGRVRSRDSTGNGTTISDQATMMAS